MNSILMDAQSNHIQEILTYFHMLGCVKKCSYFPLHQVLIAFGGLNWPKPVSTATSIPKSTKFKLVYEGITWKGHENLFENFENQKLHFETD